MIIISNQWQTMSDPPDIRGSFIAGTVLFSSTAFVTAGTYAIFQGHHQQFRYSFFTALNVGTAGGLFLGPPQLRLSWPSGIRACLLHIPGRLQNRSLENVDYVFASGISAGFVGGTFNLINSRTLVFIPCWRQADQEWQYLEPWHSHWLGSQDNLYRM